MLKIKCGNRMLHDPTLESGNDVVVWNISLTKKVNECDSLTFTIHDTHPNSQYVYPNCEEITVEKKDWVTDETSTIFYGRVLSTSINLNGERDITCEGELGYLLDSVISPFLLENVTNSEAIRHILLMHNAQVGQTGINKQINLASNNWQIDFPYIPAYDVNGDGFVFSADGRIIYIDGLNITTYFNSKDDENHLIEAQSAYRRSALGDYIYRHTGQPKDPVRSTWSSDGTERALDIIQRNLIDSFGGILSIEHENGARKLRYRLINDGREPEEHPIPITIDNLIDISYDKSAEERFTMLYPLGAEITETDSMHVRALKDKTWLAFGDGSSVCKVVNLTPISPGDGYENIASGSIALYSAKDYTGAISGGSRVQRNIHTSHGKSYINLLTEGSGMKTVTMAQETETLYKHGGHASGNNTVQNWSADEAPDSNQDKSVVERLYDMFGRAKIDSTRETITYIDANNVEKRIKTEVATGMTLESDISAGINATEIIKLVTAAKAMGKTPEEALEGYNVNPLRLSDFVTVSVGLNDWLNADSILGNNEMGRKYSAYLEAADGTAAQLFHNVSTNAIEDYMDGREKNEDGIPSEFRMTLYWQIRYLCMYLKACFPLSHIIIFSSFGKRTQTEEDRKKNGDTESQNKVGRKEWYPTNGLFESDTTRTRRDFYTETVTDPYMKQPENNSGQQSGGTQQNNEEWEKVSDSTPLAYNIIESKYAGGGSSLGRFRKKYLQGDWTKTNKTECNITTYGLGPSGTASENYGACAKVSVRSGEQSNPDIVHLRSWNSLDGNATQWTGAHGSYESSPQIIHNPYASLGEHSYSISELNDALSEVCNELGLIFVDSESATGISVNNYTEIIGNVEDIFSDQDKDGNGELDDVIAEEITVKNMPFDNLGSKSTRTGRFRESFVNGAYLNDLGQKAMARAVRNAMIDCLVSDGTLESVERLTIVGNEKPYFVPLDSEVDAGKWRCMRIVPSGEIIKPDAVYDAIFKGSGEGNITRKNPAYRDKNGYGKYDLIDAYGNYNFRAFEDLNMKTTGNDKTLEKNVDLTNELIPKAPADPIVATMEFEDMTDPQELFYAGAQYLYSNFSQTVVNITAKAIDMRIVDKATGSVHESDGAMDIGRVVLISAPNYGLANAPFVIDSITESDNPSDTVVTFKSVGSSRTASDQLAANPYGPHNKRANKIKLLFSKLSDIFNQQSDAIGNIM